MCTYMSWLPASPSCLASSKPIPLDEPVMTASMLMPRLLGILPKDQKDRPIWPRFGFAHKSKKDGVPQLETFMDPRDTYV